MNIKEDNPFREWLEEDTYGSYWVPIARLGGWTHPVALPVLFTGEKAQVLRDADWPMQLDSAGPEVWESWNEGSPSRHSELYPSERRGDLVFHPFVAMFDPFGRPSWLEPFQAFVLHWQAWPDRGADGHISWFTEGDDSQPEECARWVLENFADRVTVGRLEIRRDRLLAFLSAFDFDLAIYYTDVIEASQLDPQWTDEGSMESFAWRTWATKVSGSKTVATLRAVTVLERPPYSEASQPWGREVSTGLEYPTGMDPETGKPIMTTHPPAGFLTPVFFKKDVLEKYFADPDTYSVTDTQVNGGREWSLPIAKTGRGTVQVWLGDISRLPAHVQAHWKQYAVVDAGVPEWRLKTDLLAQFVEIPSEGSIAKLKAAIQRANEVAQARFGHQLFAPLDPMHAQSIGVLRVPGNNSMPAFLEQVRALALLVVDHLSNDFLGATGASFSTNGTLNRLAEVVAFLSGMSIDQSKDEIAGLYAVQAVRSNVTAHRTGTRATETLQRAGISRFDLPAGFRLLVENATLAIDHVATLIRAG